MSFRHVMLPQRMLDIPSKTGARPRLFVWGAHSWVKLEKTEGCSMKGPIQFSIFPCARCHHHWLFVSVGTHQGV